MTESVETEYKMLIHLTILTMKLVITLLNICKNGIYLHTSAKICAWDTNVYLT